MTETTDLTPGQEKLAVAILEYLSIVEGIYGAFHDACMGFHLVRERMINLQNYAKTQHGLEPNDSVEFLYGKGNPNEASATLLHKVSQGKLKIRNEKGGANTQFMAATCVIAIYQYWEDSYRARFAEALNLQTNEMFSEIFGDIRRIRIALVHRQGRCDKDIERCKILKWFKNGDLAEISRRPNGRDNLPCKSLFNRDAAQAFACIAIATQVSFINVSGVPIRTLQTLFSRKMHGRRCTSSCIVIKLLSF